MIEWFARPLPDFWGGVALIVIALILFVWATAAIVAGYETCGRRGLRRWDPRRVMAPCFSWWLGLSLLGIAIILSYLGYAVLTDDNDTPLWGILLCGATVGCALMAFKYWAVERLPERGL